MSETVDGSTTTYLDDPNQAYDQVLEEYEPGGALSATYIRGLDLLFQDRGGAKSYYAKDGLGSTRALTDASGTVTDTYDYDAYGDLTASTGATPNEFLFAGYQHDAAIGQDFLRARYYNAAVGRFSSFDTFEGGPGESCHAEPLRLRRRGPGRQPRPLGARLQPVGLARGFHDRRPAHEHPRRAYSATSKTWPSGTSIRFEDFAWANVGLAAGGLFPGAAAAVQALWEGSSAALGLLASLSNLIGFDVTDWGADAAVGTGDASSARLSGIKVGKMPPTSRRGGGSLLPIPASSLRPWNEITFTTSCCLA